MVDLSERKQVEAAYRRLAPLGLRIAHQEISDGADEAAVRRERSRRMLSTMDMLPAGQREALLLAYGRGLTAQEIAIATDPVGTAKSRIRLGLARVRQHLCEAA